jgi:hypothetical protein
MPAIAGPTRVAWSRPTSWPITVWIRRRAWTSRPGRRGTGPLADRDDGASSQMPWSASNPARAGRQEARSPSTQPWASATTSSARTRSGSVAGASGRQRALRPAAPAGGLGRRQRVCVAPGHGRRWPPSPPPAAVGAGLSGRPASRSCPGSSPAGQADLAEEVLAELGVDRPQIGRLPHGGGAVHPAQGRDQSPRSGGRAHSGPCRARCPGTRRRPRWSGPGWRPGAGGAGLAAPAAGQPLVDQPVHRVSSVRASMADPVPVVMAHHKAYGVTTHPNPHTGSASRSPRDRMR